MRHGSQVHGQKKREGDRCRSHYDVAAAAAADVISMADHPRTCGTPNSIVASSVLSLSASIQKPDGVFHVVHLSIHPAALAAALNTQMVWVQTEDNGSEFYAHVLTNYPWWCSSFQKHHEWFKILMQDLHELMRSISGSFENFAT